MTRKGCYILIAVLLTFTASLSQAQIPERRLDKARALVEQKKHNKAIDEYLKIRKWLQRDPGLLIEMARVYTYASRHAEAVELFEYIKKSHPAQAGEFKQELADQYAYLALNAARQLIEKKEYAGALKEYLKISVLESKDPSLTVEHARALSYAGMHTEAISLFNRALAQQPKLKSELKSDLKDQKSFLLLAEARELVIKKKYAQAIKIYDDLGKWLNRDPGLIVEKARAYAYANRHKESIEILEKAAALPELDGQPAALRQNIKQQIKKQEDFIHLSSARELVNDKRYEDALKTYALIPGLLKQDPGLVVEHARVHSYLNRHQEALDLLETAAGLQSAAKQPTLLESVLAKEIESQKDYLQLNRARQLVEQKQYKDAIEIYAKLDDLLQRDPGLLVEKARVFAYADRHQDAITLLEKAALLEKKAQTGDLRKVIRKEIKLQEDFINLSKARELVKQKRYDDAIAVYALIPDLLQEDPGLLVEYARVYSYLNRHQEAIDLLETAVSIRKKIETPTISKVAISTEIMEQERFLELNKARTLVELNRYREALDIYSSLYDILKNDPGLLVEHARVHSYVNNHIEAIRLFETAIKVAPALGETLTDELNNQKQFLRLETARTLVEREEFNEAIKIYDDLGDFLNKDPGLLVEKARVYSYANRHDEAAQIFESILKDHKGYTPVFMRELGDMYTWARYFDKAVEIYRSALTLNPNDIVSQVALARALAWKGDLKEAHSIYDKVLTSTPEHIPSLIGKADAYTMRDRLGAAGKLLDKVQELEPGNVDAINMRARILVWQGQHHKGVDLYKELLDLYPNNLEALEGLAFGLHWADRDPEAFDVLEKLLVLRPSRKKANQLLGRIRNARRPEALLYGIYIDDNKPRTSLEYGVSVKSLLTAYLSVDLRYGHKRIEEKESVEKELDADIVGFLTSWHITRRLILNIDLQLTDYDQADWTELFYDAELEWRPSDTVYLDVGFDHDTVNSIEPISNELTEDSISARIKWKPDRMWDFSAEQTFGDYSDDNEKDSTLLIAEYRAMQTPYLTFYYNYYRGQWDTNESDYFSPEDFNAHTLGAYLSRRFSVRHFGYLQGSLGREDHGEGVDNIPNYYLVAGYEYRPNDNWKINLRGSYFNSDADEEKGHDRYRETQVWAGISRSFGGNVGVARADTVAPTPVPENR